MKYKEELLAASIMFIALISCTEVDAQTATYNGQTYSVTEETDLSINEPVVVNGTLYVPRSYRIRNRRDPGMGERIVGRAITNTLFEVESSISNGIDRKIYELGKKIDEKLGTY